MVVASRRTLALRCVDLYGCNTLPVTASCQVLRHQPAQGHHPHARLPRRCAPSAAAGQPPVQQISSGCTSRAVMLLTGKTNPLKMPLRALRRELLARRQPLRPPPVPVQLPVKPLVESLWVAACCCELAYSTLLHSLSAWALQCMLLAQHTQRGPLLARRCEQHLRRRPFFYTQTPHPSTHHRWPWQFRAIDRLAAQAEAALQKPAGAAAVQLQREHEAAAAGTRDAALHT